MDCIYFILFCVRTHMRADIFFLYYFEAFFALRRSKASWISYAKGVATQSEEYVPTTTPIINANTKPRIVSPPKQKIAINTTKVDIEVEKVRLNVWFNASLMFCLRARFGYNPVYSRTRSKITTVSLIE